MPDEEELRVLDHKLKQLKLDYDRYFLGSRPREPVVLRADVDKLIAIYSNQPITNSGLRFRFSSLCSRYQALKRQWSEILRQIETLENGGTIGQETRLWDAGSRMTRSMRSKEQAHDYRYFPEPDLPPVVVTDEQIDRLGATLPELAATLSRLDSGPSTEADPAGAATCTHVASGPSTEADPDGETTRTHTPSDRPSGNGAGSGSQSPERDPAARFAVLRPLARGNLGEVFVARDGELDREVALKEIRADRSQRPESQARFVLEAEITGGLEHPGIIPVYSLGRHADGRPYYAMRLVRGEALRDAIRRFHQRSDAAHDPEDRNLELRQLLRRFVDLCNAIAYAHNRRVIHRDIKPANVVFDQKSRRVRVMDFGVARLENSRATRTGVILGSPSYMAPEQLDARPVTAQSDLFSLGVTLFQLLTGMLPFRSDSIPGLMQKISAEPHPPLRVVRPDLPAALAAIVDRALEKDPDARYRSGAEMAQALRDCAREIDPALR